jgi:hypothetical protein
MREENKIWSEHMIKAIPGFEGLYSADADGRIISHHSQKPKYLRHAKHWRGYLVVGLSKNGVRKSYRLHRLVAMAFHPNPENKLFVNHINGIKTDNRPSNLEWCSPSENMIHSYVVLKRHGSSYGKFGADNPSSKPIYQYSKCGKLIKRYDSISTAARENRASAGNISNAASGRVKSAYGCIWRFNAI